MPNNILYGFMSERFKAILKKYNNKKRCIPKIKTGIKSVLVGSHLLCTSLQNRQLYCD